MSIAERNAELIRRRAILALVFFATGQTLSARQARDELEAIHGQIATVDKVRAEFLWLADVGLLRTAGDVATLTERGREVVMDRAAMPGEV